MINTAANQKLLNGQNQAPIYERVEKELQRKQDKISLLEQRVTREKRQREEDQNKVDIKQLKGSEKLY